MMNLWMLVATAVASSSYPADLETDLAMPCVAPCTVCHETNTGGSGTVVQPFGVAMMARGLDGGGQSALLTSALDAMTADGVDSDGDGTADVDALASGDDPNGGAPFCDAPAPIYGCFNQAGVAAGLPAVLASLLALRRRRVVSRMG